MQVKYSIETLKPEDLTQALLTVRQSATTVRAVIPAPGVGVDVLLERALADIADAARATAHKDVERAATNAIGNARRALACLVDWYLYRDGFCLCRNAPRGARAKSAILKSRGLVDELTSRVLARAIAVRNRAEHEYDNIGLDDAEDVVELLRRTTQVLRTTSNPAHAHCILGSMQYSMRTGPEEREVLFRGWVPNKACIVVALFASEPWVGIVIPQDKRAAVVRKVTFRNLDTDIWSDALSHLDSITPTLSISTYDVRTLCRLLEVAGLAERPGPATGTSPIAPILS